MGNPSDHVETPLTGGYLLIVLAEPRSAEHKLAILKKLTKGLSCWNYDESGVDIVTEFNAIVNQNIEGEEGKNGEQLFQYASDNLVAEILINPQHSTLVQCVRNLLASFTKYRCIIHAGYSFTENGSWILQDGSFSVTDFLDAYKTAEAQRTIRLHENQIRIELHCSADADWNHVSRVKGTRFLLNPPEKIVDIESIETIVRWLCDKIEVTELDVLLEGSQVVGNIRFSRPTLYVFPAGQGDSALFGINGFNMLIDGGAGRNSCFWGFARHLDRLDAVLLTRLNSSNLEGVASFLKRKTMSSLYPQIGHFFCNFKTRKQISSPNIDAKQDVLSISLIDTAQSIITDLKQLQLRPHLCYRNINLEPINLYHKVGHGKLDMYVLNPSKDSKEVKDFLTKWNEGDQKLFNPTKDLQFPLPNIISVCTLLVWQPANPNTTITRILFPGSSPQNKIFESLERVRHLDFLKHPSCSIKSMSSSTSVTVKSQTTKKTVLEKMIPGETKTVKTLENLEVSTSASNAVIQTAIIPTVPKEGTPKPKFSVEAEKPKPSIKLVMKETANAKPKIEHKYSSISAKVNSNKVVQKSSTTKKSLKLSSKSPPTDKSSPTTPIENQEKVPKPIKQVIKPKTTSTTTKSPSSTPTKSKKEEANRRVLVSARTNSGLKRTPITKKDTKPTNPKITETSLKKDSNIVYKSSLISCNKDKSGEEEDILIVEKVAITPEKLLTPDGKKIIANELDGILTTAKDIVTKEKLSDSGATTAPTMPEDEKITESKKEIEVNESDKKIEEFKKAKDALKTPDEVADLPFHEEADEQKPKVAEKEIESEIETQEIVQVENAEYVLVSLDSSPEVLKRQVLDTVGLLDTELDEDSDKEDEYVETKQSTMLPDIDEKTKLIEHLLESSKDLCEITEKIDELKKQNEHEITNHQIHDHLQNSNHDNTSTSGICTQLNKQEKPTLIQEEVKIELQEKECIDEQWNIENKSDKAMHGSDHTEVHSAVKGENTENLKQITTAKGIDTKLENVENKNIFRTITNPDSMKSNQDGNKISTSQELEIVSTDLNLHDDSNMVNTQQKPSRSNSLHQEQDKTNITMDKKDSKASSKAGSVDDESLTSPVHEKISSTNAIRSRCGSTEEPDRITENSTDKQRSKASSKASSICDEPLKSPGPDISTDNINSSSICQEQDTTNNVEDKQESKASSKAGSVCNEPVKSPVHETVTSAKVVTNRSGSIIDEPESIPDNISDTQKSKESSRAGSVCDEPVISPVHGTITTGKADPSRSSSITEEQEITEEITIDKQGSKASSKANSVVEEPTIYPEPEISTDKSETKSRSNSVSQALDIAHVSVTDKQESKASSDTTSICDEPVKSPFNETVDPITSRSSSITHEPENTTKNTTGSKASSKASSVCDEPIKSPVHETITSTNAVLSESGSITDKPEIVPDNVTDMQRSKASSKASSICDEPVKSPVYETIESAIAVVSRSDSVTDKPENFPDKVTEIQSSKASSRASSICDEPIKSPFNETVNPITSRSSSITHEPENTTNNTTGSKASSKASSICDEPVKSPVHETITSANAVSSRSSSITDKAEIVPDNTTDMQRSKTSSKASSVCDEPVKSPVHETVNEITSRSSSVTHEPLNITKNETGSKASSKASSVCDEPVKSPVHETITSANAVSSRSSSIADKAEIVPDNTTDMERSKASSKTSSVCDEPVKSPVHETVNAITSRSSSITHELENTTKNVTDSKASSRASSVCDEPLKSPDHETTTLKNPITSISSTISQIPESIPENETEKQGSKLSVKSGSVCDEPVTSPLSETTISENAITNISSSITQEPESATDNQYLKTSSKTNSISEELLKSSELAIINTNGSESKSKSSSVNQEQDITHVSFIDKHVSNSSGKAGSVCDEMATVQETISSGNDTTNKSELSTQYSESTPANIMDKQELNASSKSGSVCDELLKSHSLKVNAEECVTKDILNAVSDKMESTTYSIDADSECSIRKGGGVISNRTNTREELLESLPNSSTVDEIKSDKSQKEQESITDTECTPIIGMVKHDVESCSRKDSFCQDKNKSSTFSSSSTSSICQEIDTQSSKLSSRKSSVVDESIDNPSKLQIVEKSSSLQESNVYEHDIDDNSKIFIKSGSLCEEMLNLSFNKETENIISNKAYEQVVSPATTVGNTESKIVNKVEPMCEESIKSDNDEICTKEHLISSTSNLILNETEEDKCQLPRKSSEFEKPQNLLTEDNNTILSPSDCNKNKSNVIEKKAEESKSFGRIGSLCEEITKFLTDNDNKVSTNITSESPCSLIESIPLKSNIEELKVETETLLQLDKNSDPLNKIEKSLQLDDKVKVGEKHDNINDKNTDHSLPVKNITVSNNKSPSISTLLIEENNKTGIMNVAQMVGKNIIDESLTKHAVITDNESKNLKTVTPIAKITSEECISKLSNVLIEDVVKISDDKNIICDSSITDICMNQPLGVTLNSEDLGVTKDIVMQLKRDVHEALHQCSSDDERPFTPQSESSMSRSAMNIDDDDDDNEDNKIETDDDMPGSPVSTGPSSIQMQLDNRHVEINMDFNKALQEHRITRGEDLTTTEANGNHVTTIKTTEHDNINQNQGTSSDTVQSWGKPLGLPPVQSINNNGFDPIREWGKPLGLPSPTQPILELAEPQNMSGKTTPKKNVKKIIDNKPIINVMDKDAQNRIRRSESPSKLRSRSSSRMSRINPIYLDLIYVPHHGNSKYVSADFFKRIRARNYVFSGTDPSKEVLNALIEGKQAWEDQDLEVTIIPTYDTDTLGQWVAENEELLTKLKIDLSPSASRCTIKLQDHNTSCSAYRLEF